MQRNAAGRAGENHRGVARPWLAPLALALVVLLANGSTLPAQQTRAAAGTPPNGRTGNPRQNYGPVQRTAQATPQAAPGRTAPTNGPLPLAIPPWANQLTAEHQKYLDQILKYWEFRSSKIEVFKCDFQRWRYDPVFVKADPETGKLPFKETTTGIIRYERPDKALYKDDKVFVYQPAKEQGGKAGYVQLPAESGEHWICNGEAVFEYDYGRKQLIETHLPPEYRGNKIVENGPLPFLFGAKADKIKQRYWLRVITPDNAEGEYWIEAYPKNQEDAANFKMIHIIIDETDYLPKALIMFNRNFDPVRHPARTTFEFKNRIVNPTLDQLNKLNLLHRDFYDPKTPSGWEKVVEPYRGNEPPAATARPGSPNVQR